jgi:crotonobetainyl-CoA:carnitine CoA-transferase CaiB-like acyl-CoA transferase
MCGMYAATAILAAIRHRDQTGEGQHLDIALYDTQVAWLANEGTNWLLTHERPERRGNAHATIVPYRVFATRDGHVVLAVGNDLQFGKFATLAGRPELASDARFATNDARVRHREACDEVVARIVVDRSTDEWIQALAVAGVPCAPVRSVDEVFADPHTQARGMEITMDAPALRGGALHLIGNPIHASATPPSYRHAPPTLGEHGEEILSELGLSTAEIAALVERSVVALSPER